MKLMTTPAVTLADGGEAPEGILDALTPQQVRDLFAFLMGK